MYDASGSKQQKTVIDNVANKKTVTTYIGAFVYQYTAIPSTGTGLDTLQFIGDEEGRIRPRNVAKSDTMNYDVFEKDHLGNTRVVLTDEQQQDVYPAATLENNANSFNTESSYYNIKTSDTVSVNKIASWVTTTGNNYPNNNGNPPYNNNPYSNTTATSNFVYHLNGNTGDKSGLGITLRVMSGDIVNIYAKSFWHNSTGANPNNSYLISSLLNSFIGAFAGTPAVTGVHGATAATLEGAPLTTSGVTSWVNNVPNPTGVTVPKAYINWILFNDQFVPVASNCGYDLVNTSPDAVKNHTPVVNVKTSGYLYVYCSNESNVDVYFDNLQLIQTRGPLLETTNYYPFGLTMAGISDKAAIKLENKYKYNGKELQHQEFSDGSGLEIYDYGARMQDPQLGRWWSLDPYSDKYYNLSTFSYCANNPINRFDPNGKEIIITNGYETDAGKEFVRQLNSIFGNKVSASIGSTGSLSFIKNGKLTRQQDLLYKKLNGMATNKKLSMSLTLQPGLGSFDSYPDGYIFIDDMNQLSNDLKLGRSKGAWYLHVMVEQWNKQAILGCGQSTPDLSQSHVDPKIINDDYGFKDSHKAGLDAETELNGLVISKEEDLPDGIYNFDFSNQNGEYQYSLETKQDVEADHEDIRYFKRSIVKGLEKDKEMEKELLKNGKKN